MKTPSAALRSVLFALRGGFLIRPFLISFALGTSGAIISAIEERYPELQRFVPSVLFPSHGDPQVAQSILTTIATGTMTVVSIVFAILLMTLTLASTQFSPRILISFVRDRVTQWTLGVFLGTFCYCIAALPAARLFPSPFVPVLTTAGAMVLAPVCVGWLIYFIHHVSLSISVNTILDRIRKDTEDVIDELMPFPRSLMVKPDGTAGFERLDGTVLSKVSGYIRYADIDQLRWLAKRNGTGIRQERRVGHFVPAGVPIFKVTRRDRLTSGLAEELSAALEIGPSRTMQQDLEFGIVQIVDIALRAMSSAVNDPTTAMSCVDQLTSILIRWISRSPPRSHYYDPPHILRVIVPWIKLDGLLDLAFEQIRHYAASDTAVSLRLMRAFADIACTSQDPEVLELLVERGRRLMSGCETNLPEGDLERLRQRFKILEDRRKAASI